MNSIRIDDFAPTGLLKNEQIKSNGSDGFKDVIKNVIDSANNTDKESDKSILDLIQGKEDVHTTMIALQKADISMKMLLSVRNKVIDAYREIMRMQF